MFANCHGAAKFVTHVYPPQQPENSALRYYFEMEGHLIHVLQFRQVSLPERLAMVRQTIDSLSRLTAPDTSGEGISTGLFKRIMTGSMLPLQG